LLNNVFLGVLAEPLPAVGDRVELAGDEGRHAAVVRRIRTGEVVVISDGAGRAVQGPVVAVSKQGIVIEVAAQLAAPPPAIPVTAVQALAKGDRGELAVEVMTEAGVSRVVPWQASRSIVRWTAERAEKSLRRWQNSAREAAKQSRRLWLPEVTDVVTTAALVTLIGEVAERGGMVLVLHESAVRGLVATVREPSSPPTEIMIIIGPEGGISDEELAAFDTAGAQPVLLGDTVLRTSTAGVVALAQIQAVEALRTSSGVETSPHDVARGPEGDQ